MSKCFIRKVFLLIIALVSISAKSTTKPNDIKMIIDQDAGSDDAMAVFITLLYEKYFYGPQVLALTTTHGNVDEPQAYVNTQRILLTAERQDVPIYRGANFSLVRNEPTDNYFGLDGLGDTDYDNYTQYHLVSAQSKHAALALIDYSKAYEGRLDILALGVLTNIALAIRLDPGFLGRLRHLYIASGNIQSEEFPSAEFNGFGDVEAYKAVIDSATPNRVTVLPFSSVEQLNVSMVWRTEVLGMIPTKIMQTLNQYERIALSKYSEYGWSMLDPMAAAIALHEKIITKTNTVLNSIILCGKDRGTNTNEIVTGDDANVELVYSLNKEAYKNFLLDVFLAELELINKK